MFKAKNHPWSIFISMLILTTTLLGCSLSSLIGSTPATPTQAVETAVGAPPTPTTDFAVETAAAQATQAANDAAATQVAQQTQDAAAVLGATKTAIAPIEISLAGLGVMTSEGKIYVADPDVKQHGSGFQQLFYSDQFPGVSGKDVAIQSDILWESKFGDAGCGFAIRSNGGGAKATQYVILAMRELGGYISFRIMNEGNIINKIDTYPQMYNPKFSWANGVTNRIAVVMRGTKAQVFSDGVIIAVIDVTQPPAPPVYPEAPVPPQNNKDKNAMAEYKKELEAYNKQRAEITQQYQLLMSRYKSGVTDLPAGYAYLVTYSGSGDVTCQFKNSFLWVSNNQ